MPYKDPDELKAYRKRHYLENKERIKAQHKHYREVNRETIAKQQHESYVRRHTKLRANIHGPCYSCGSVNTAIRQGIALWYREKDGKILCGACHTKLHIQPRYGMENNLYGKYGSEHPGWRDKSDRVCYSCGSTTPYMRPDGTIMWIQNRMSNGTVTWLCNVCWGNILGGYKLSKPKPSEERQCYSCGSKTTKYEPRRGIYRWWLNYPTPYVLCHYCKKDIENNRPVRTYFCDNCFIDTWKETSKKQRHHTQWWTNEDGSMEELCRTCYHSKHATKIHTERRNRENLEHSKLVKIIAKHRHP